MIQNAKRELLQCTATQNVVEIRKAQGSAVVDVKPHLVAQFPSGFRTFGQSAPPCGKYQSNHHRPLPPFNN